MKSILLSFAVLSGLAIAVPERSMICYSRSESQLLKRFTIGDVFGKPWGENMDARLLDNVERDEKTVSFFLTNQCDNGFDFSFATKAFDAFAAGKRKWLRGTVEYGYYAGLVSDPEEPVEGTASIWCRLIKPSR